MAEPPASLGSAVVKSGAPAPPALAQRSNVKVAPGSMALLRTSKACTWAVKRVSAAGLSENFCFSDAPSASARSKLPMTKAAWAMVTR